MSSFLQPALYFASRGWPVVPVHHQAAPGLCSCGDALCRGIGKHPRMEHAHRFASKEPAIITAWWTKNPNDNIAIASGSRSGLIVLDIDPRHEGDRSLFHLIHQHGALPHTVRVFTGGGGEHLFFRAPKMEVRGRIGMLPGIDVRAEDQLFVAPPSRHLSGRIYRWDDNAHPDKTPIAELPGWLLNRILTKNSPKRKTGTSRKTKSGIELPDDDSPFGPVAHVVDKIKGWNEP